MLLQLHLWMLLLLSTWSSSGHSKDSSPPEIVTLLRVTDTRKHISPDWLSYSLHFGGQKHIITLKPKKHLISRNFLLFTYSDKGDLLEEQPFVQRDCYYHGYVDGDPESMVIINNCFGSFQGILEINGTAYEIMPKSSNSTFEHLAYKMGSEESETFPMRCRLTEEEIARQVKLQESNDDTLLQQPHTDWWTHQKYIEYFVIIDHNQYLHRERNLTKCLHDILQLISAMNAYYLQMGLEVILTTFEVWNEQNLINVKEDIHKVLSNFCSWKKKNIGDRVRHDIIHLFVKQGYGVYMGLANVGTVCTSNNCAVNTFTTDSMSDMRFIMAHEIGHNLGMMHDKQGCSCGKGKCIMAAYKSNSKKFSNCSYEEMFSVVSRRTCLYNNPEVALALHSTSCGNNVVEEGEQCDCGDSVSCSNDSCCTEECVFRPNVQCASGLCCNDCQFFKTGTVCREEQNECDLPEWCDGTSAECPEDVYILDGSPCKESGSCYKMVCRDLNDQCQSIFGDEATSADEVCYKEMNKQGNRFGNCGNISTTYKKCSPENAFCGRVQCDNVPQVPPLKSHETVHWTKIRGSSCWTMEHHFGKPEHDRGAVADGTSCHPERICLNRNCVSRDVLVSNCSKDICNMQGVCNNKHHCHCDLKWEPPDCLKIGFGGSVDSGPPPRTTSRMKTATIYLLGIFIPLAVLLFILLFVIVKNAQSEDDDESEETEKEPQPQPKPKSKAKAKPEPGPKAKPEPKKESPAKGKPPPKAKGKEDQGKKTPQKK